MNTRSTATAFETVMLKIGIAKVSLDSTTIFFKAIMCNLMVCLAVWLAYSCRTVADKIIAIILPISGFVAAGFEHCVANMYFLPFAYLLKETGNVPEGMDVSALSIASIAHNILFATAGNIVGGGLFVGALYWAIYRKGMGGTGSGRREAGKDKRRERPGGGSAVVYETRSAVPSCRPGNFGPRLPQIRSIRTMETHSPRPWSS